MKKTLLCSIFALSLAATAQEFIVPFGYEEPWVGKLLFNSEGGYNFDYASPSNNPLHAWEQLYEVQDGDTYTIIMPTACKEASYGRVQFKTPITLLADHSYRIYLQILSDKELSGVNIALCENEDDDVCLVSGTVDLQAGRRIAFNRSSLTGLDIADAKIALEFPTTEDNTTITLSNISIYDQTDRKDIWKGTSFYNWCYYADEWGNRIKDMQINGRTETLSWTEPGYNDSQWSEALMPIGSPDVSFIQTVWPGGDNTNFWFRRTFTLDEVNKTSRYMLHVLHDDNYRIWVNGIQLDEANNWTTGTNAVKLEVMSTLLQEGNNVIAAYVQQNWGGKLYDCALTEEAGFYEGYDPDADPSKLVFNEIMIGNIDQFIDYSWNYGAWAEIYNPTYQSIQLDGLYITDDEAELLRPQLGRRNFWRHSLQAGSLQARQRRRTPLPL